MIVRVSGLLLLLAAYALLVPGLTEPMLSVSGTVEKAKLIEIGRDMLLQSDALPGFMSGIAERVIDGMDTRGTISAFDKTRSILGTAEELRAGGHLPVAALIVLFSVGVPLIKALVLIAALSPLPVRWRRRLAAFANASGKWSMADVFVIAIFIAFLAGNGLQESRGLVDFEASLGVGFWYFLGYCLVSLAGTQLLVHALRRRLDEADGVGLAGGASGAAAPSGRVPPPLSSGTLLAGAIVATAADGERDPSSAGEASGGE